MRLWVRKSKSFCCYFCIFYIRLQYLCKNCCEESVLNPFSLLKRKPFLKPLSSCPQTRILARVLDMTQLKKEKCGISCWSGTLDDGFYLLVCVARASGLSLIKKQCFKLKWPVAYRENLNGVMEWDKVPKVDLEWNRLKTNSTIMNSVRQQKIPKSNYSPVPIANRRCRRKNWKLGLKIHNFDISFDICHIFFWKW